MFFTKTNEKTLCFRVPQSSSLAQSREELLGSRLRESVILVLTKRKADSEDENALKSFSNDTTLNLLPFQWDNLCVFMSESHLNLLVLITVIVLGVACRFCLSVVN